MQTRCRKARSSTHQEPTGHVIGTSFVSFLFVFLCIYVCVRVLVRARVLLVPFLKEWNCYEDTPKGASEGVRLRMT
jgi:hypothetical protein